MPETPDPRSPSAPSVHPSSRLALPARRAVLALLLAGAAWALGVEVLRLGAEVARPPNPGAVAEWRLTTPRAESLARFLHAMDAELPPDSKVAFATAEEVLDQDYFLSLWAAYLMPRHRVVRRLPVLDLRDVEYVVAYNTELDEPGLREMARHVSGHLYRVEPVGGGATTAGAGEGER